MKTRLIIVIILALLPSVSVIGTGSGILIQPIQGNVEYTTAAVDWTRLHQRRSLPPNTTCQVRTGTGSEAEIRFNGKGGTWRLRENTMILIENNQVHIKHGQADNVTVEENVIDRLKRKTDDREVYTTTRARSDELLDLAAKPNGPADEESGDRPAEKPADAPAEKR
jgi:hypothetical protein